MKVAVLGSGSGGNCTLLEGPSTRLLVDAGFGLRSFRRRLAQANLTDRPADAILVSHGHSDHVDGIPSLVRSESTPVFMNNGARKDAPRLDNVENRRPVPAATFRIGDFRVTPFAISHDACQPLGFAIECGGVRGVVVTDLGRITAPVRRVMRRCDWLVIESNHDEDMVRVGPYPWHLKHRVLGSEGHLSNRELGVFLASDDFDGCPTHLFLAHLSRQNNATELAREEAENALGNRFPLFRHSQTSVHLTHQSKPSIVVSL